MIDWAVTGLTHRIGVDMLDTAGHLIGAMPSVRSGKITLRAGATIRGSGTLDLTITAPTDLQTVLARPWIEVTDGADTGRWNLLTAILEADDTDIGDGQLTHVTAQMLDLTARLDDTIGPGYSLPAGTLITGAVRQILTTQQLDAVAITESSATTQSDMNWPTEKTWRNVVNDLLDAANYAAIWCDADGTAHVHPYVLPAARPITHRWAHGPTATFRPTRTVSTNASQIPNHLTVIGKPVGEDDPPVVERWDTDPSSRWSTVTRGRTIPRQEGNVDWTDLPALEAKADRLWQTARSLSIKHQVSLRWEPGWLAELVEFRPAGASQPIFGTIEGWECSWTAGQPLSPVTVTLQEVTP